MSSLVGVLLLVLLSCPRRWRGSCSVFRSPRSLAVVVCYANRCSTWILSSVVSSPGRNVAGLCILNSKICRWDVSIATRGSDEFVRHFAFNGIGKEMCFTEYTRVCNFTTNSFSPWTLFSLTWSHSETVVCNVFFSLSCIFAWRS